MVDLTIIGDCQHTSGRACRSSRSRGRPRGQSASKFECESQSEVDPG